MKPGILDTELGHYKPSFFEIYLNSDKTFDDFGALEIPVFVHEYIHFLQDISTTFGMINTSYTVEYIKSLMNMIRRTPEEEVNLPIDIAELHPSVSLNDRIFASVYFGDQQDLSYAQGPMITHIESKNEDIADGIAPEIFYVGINYGGAFPEHLWQFGAITIMESMAHIIEQHLFPEFPPSSSLQYHLAELVTEHVYPAFATPLNVLMLCDVSLLSYNPGETFIRILYEMKNCGFMLPPCSLEDFYKYALSYVHLPGDNGNPTDLIGLLATTASTTEQNVNDLFTARELASVGKWAGGLVKKGAEKRISKNHFISELLTLPKDQARKEFFDLILQLGVPIITNASGISWAPTNSFQGLASPLLLPAMYDVYTTFRYGKKSSPCKRKCGCQNSSRGVIVNNFCDSTPWKRLDNPQDLCLFAQACKMWGVPSDKQITLTA